MRKYYVGVISILAVMLSVSGVAFSEEMADMSLEYSFGNIKSVAGKVITIEGYDDESNEEIDIAFTVADSAVLEGINSIEELAKDSWVDVGYVSKDGQNIAYEVLLNE